ncbi:MAG: metal-sensing transcriptional repressor [Roseburia sp.]|nr:metal-sensing transcriptional repressor [Roseburia sp.]
MKETHTHVLEDGTVVTHSHEESRHVHSNDSHAHGHPHHHENTKAVLNRMNRAIGHMESIKTMIESGRDCSEVLIQIAAVRSAINNIGKVILEDHINHCIVDAVETGDDQALKDLNEAINKFIK